MAGGTLVSFTAAVKLGTVTLPVAIVADYGVHRAALVGGVLGFAVGASIMALWLFMTVLMLRFFPEPQAKAVCRPWRWALWTGFTLALFWAVTRAYHFYRLFDDLKSLPGSFAILLIWGTTAWYLLALGAWVAAIREKSKQ